jgi:hypothetical protein
MTNTKKTIKGLMAALVALAMTVALGVSMFASAADTVTETVVVTQVIEKGTVPSRNSYTYVLTPKRAENPMPEGTKDGSYTLPIINGETTDSTAPSFTIEIDVSKPGVYEYVLQKLETTPNGDTFSPDSHIFGYKVELNDKGELVAIPYICQSGNPVFSDPDENGYPTKLTLVNTIKGKPTSTAKPVTQKPTTRLATTAKGGTSNSITNTRARWVNTGDESQILFWVIVLGVALAGLLLVILIRRRHDDDEESI